MPKIPSTKVSELNKSNICKPPATQCSRNQSSPKCKPNYSVPCRLQKQSCPNPAVGGNLSGIRTSYETQKYVFETSPRWSQPKSRNDSIPKLPCANGAKTCSINAKQVITTPENKGSCFRSTGVNGETKTCQANKDKIFGAMVQPYICKEDAVKMNYSQGGSGSPGSQDTHQLPSLPRVDSRGPKFKPKKSGDLNVGDEGYIEKTDAEMTTARFDDRGMDYFELDSEGNPIYPPGMRFDSLGNPILPPDMRFDSLGNPIYTQEAGSSTDLLGCGPNGSIIEKGDAELTTAAIKFEDDAKSKQKGTFGGGSRLSDKCQGASGGVRTMSRVQKEFCQRIKGLSCRNPNATCKTIALLWCRDKRDLEYPCDNKGSHTNEPTCQSMKPISLYYGMGKCHLNGKCFASIPRCRSPQA